MISLLRHRDQCIVSKRLNEYFTVSKILGPNLWIMGIAKIMSLKNFDKRRRQIGNVVCGTPRDIPK